VRPGKRNERLHGLARRQMHRRGVRFAQHLRRRASG
jgi:hypothetical protein